jgi:rhamnosyl/mannosyltransferase
LATDKVGIENTIFTLSPNHQPSSLKLPEASVVRRKSWIAPFSCDIGGLQAVQEFRTLAKRVDVIVYHFPWPFADLLSLFSDHGKPSVLVYHSDIVRQKVFGRLYAPLMWKMLSKMSIIVATSPKYVETSPILSHSSIRSKVRTVPLGIVEHWHDRAVDSDIHSRLKISPNERYFLFIGVLRYYKGLQYLVEAASHVSVKIVIAGSGPEKAKLESMAVAVGVENIVFAGRVTEDEKVDLLKNCYGLILPSHLRSEAFGVVLIEAAMFQKPMISCEIGTGTSYANLDRTSGIVVEPRSSEALAVAMNELLDDAALASSMGRAARERYENQFSGNALATAYKEIFEELVQ